MISQLLLTVSRYRVSRYRQTLAINKRRRLHLSPTSTGRAFFVMGVLLTLGLLSLYGWRTVASAAAQIVTNDPVTAAWQKARASGSYNFDADMTQVTIPNASVTNVGRGSHSEQVHLEGQTNIRANDFVEAG